MTNWLALPQHLILQMDLPPSRNYHKNHLSPAPSLSTSLARTAYMGVRVCSVVKCNLAMPIACWVCTVEKPWQMDYMSTIYNYSRIFILFVSVESCKVSSSWRLLFSRKPGGTDAYGPSWPLSPGIATHEWCHHLGVCY